MAVVGAGGVVCCGECYLERCVVLLWYFRVLFECWLSVVCRVGAVSVVVYMSCVLVALVFYALVMLWWFVVVRAVVMRTTVMVVLCQCCGCAVAVLVLPYVVMVLWQSCGCAVVLWQPCGPVVVAEVVLSYAVVVVSRAI
jgi:hypothetical protein